MTTETFAHVADRLDVIARQGRQIAAWWRDDDAVEQTPALAALFDRATRFDVPLTLAVIPAKATASLLDSIRDQPLISVHQHGFAHVNHAPEGSKKAEFGPHRPVDDMLAELFEGYRRMSVLFGPRFSHVLTPPWNRIAPDLANRRKEIGLVGLSTYGPAPERSRGVINTHLDPIDWRRGKRYLGDNRTVEVLTHELDRRIAGSDEPLGLLTHHLVQSRETWAFVDSFLDLFTRHDAVVWPTIEELFDLK